MSDTNTVIVDASLGPERLPITADAHAFDITPQRGRAAEFEPATLFDAAAPSLMPGAVPLDQQPKKPEFERSLTPSSSETPMLMDMLNIKTQTDDADPKSHRKVIVLLVALAVLGGALALALPKQKVRELTQSSDMNDVAAQTALKLDTAKSSTPKKTQPQPSVTVAEPIGVQDAVRATGHTGRMSTGSVAATSQPEDNRLRGEHAKIDSVDGARAKDVQELRKELNRLRRKMGSLARKQKAVIRNQRKPPVELRYDSKRRVVEVWVDDDTKASVKPRAVEPAATAPKVAPNTSSKTSESGSKSGYYEPPPPGQRP